MLIELSISVSDTPPPTCIFGMRHCYSITYGVLKSWRIDLSAVSYRTRKKICRKSFYALF